MICIPSIVAFFNLPKDNRALVSSFIGGAISLVVVPLLSVHIKHKNTKIDELYKLNITLYEKLIPILFQLLVDEYLLHGKSFIQEVNASEVKEKVKEIVNPLKIFICDNYDIMCNTFSFGLISSIIDVYKLRESYENDILRLLISTDGTIKSFCTFVHEFIHYISWSKSQLQNQ